MDVYKACYKMWFLFWSWGNWNSATLNDILGGVSNQPVNHNIKRLLPHSLYHGAPECLKKKKKVIACIMWCQNEV